MSSRQQRLGRVAVNSTLAVILVLMAMLPPFVGAPATSVAAIAAATAAQQPAAQRKIGRVAALGRRRAFLLLPAGILLVFLFVRLHSWWWSWMPKYLFFLVLGIIAFGLLLVFRRIRSRLTERAV